MKPASKAPCAGKHELQHWSSAFLILKPSMAFKISFFDSQTLTKGYFRDIPNFRWADVADKDEMGKGSFESAINENCVPAVVVKRFFGEGE